MAMKVQTKRWVFALSVAGSLVAVLLYLDRTTPAVQYTQIVPTAPASAALSAAPLPGADPGRERNIVQTGFRPLN